MPLEPGKTIAHYRIDRKIGEGGMGVVYQAEDTRLGRRVALKVLPAEMAGDAARRARFEREARAIAALNHPNIVTLHSVEEADGITFLTMELVDGKPLSQLVPRDGLDLPKLLEWSQGIVDALVAAHRQGVVHRDLKPDNVMVTADGRIKVLDFGLAKLREPVPDGRTAAAPTMSVTEEGKILGTVAYMSPEQAEGKPLDQRSDVFSFGVLLYELATGRRPFQGDTSISTISSILKDTPPPPQQINPALPQHLGRIVRRCLAKEPERRYQSTDDLRNELRELKEESESGELTVELSAAAAQTAARAAGKRVPGWLVGVGAVAVLALLAAVGAMLLGRKAAPAADIALAAPIQMSRATTDGKVEEAAISPDGRYVAYVRRDGTAFSLRLRQIATGDEVQVVAASEALLTAPSFSADGDFLYYVSVDIGRPSGWAHRVSVLGGTPRRIVDGVFSVAASPDGSQLALAGATIEQSWVRIAGPEGNEPRELLQRTGRDHFDTGAEWSSDGRRLALVSHRYGEPQRIVVIDAASGREEALTVPTLRSISALAWMPGKDSLVVTGSERPVNQGAASQIWEVTAQGDLRPLTRDLNTYSNVSVTADGATIAAVQIERRSGIDVAPVRDGAPGAFTEMFPISAARPGLGGIAWIGGDRLAHGMSQGDMQQVFVTDVASKASRALTTGVPHDAPAVSRDGHTVVVVRMDGDRNQLWRFDPDTGGGQPLTQGPFDAFAAVSADGSTVVYSSAGEDIQLFKVPGGGGDSVEMSDRPTWCADMSVEGDALCLQFRPSGEAEAVLLAVAGGAARPVPDIPPTAKMVRFGPDGRSITYIVSHEGADELWRLSPEGGAPERLVRFDGLEISDFAWSPDGTRLAVVKVSRSGDVVLLKRTPA